MKDKRSWDQNKSTHTVGKGGGMARKVSGGKVTKKVEDLQLGNTWAVKKIKTKRDQSKTLNVLLVLRGGSCRDAGDGNQGIRSQLKDISEQDEGCISCLPMHPLSYSSAPDWHNSGQIITARCSCTEGGSITACIMPSSAENQSV